MPEDLDCADLDEVRRRVVDPALAALFRPDELETADVVLRPPTGSYLWTYDVPEAGPREVEVVLTAVGEQYVHRIGFATFERWDATEILDHLADELSDWITETRFGWTQRRILELDAAPVAPPPRPTAGPTAEIYVGEEALPLYSAGIALDPTSLGLSDALAADLVAWRASVKHRLDALIPDEPDEPPSYPSAAGAYVSVLTIRSHEEEAELLRARAVVQAEADAAWREVVDVLEAERDALVERLRAELGPGWQVATPTRVP